MSPGRAVRGPTGMTSMPPQRHSCMWTGARGRLHTPTPVDAVLCLQTHTGASVQACNSTLPRARVPWGPLALGPAVVAGVLPCPAPGHSTWLPCCHACPVSLQAAAPRGCAVPASQCSCAWRASPSSRRSWLTMRRTASGRVSVARGRTHTTLGVAWAALP